MLAILNHIERVLCNSALALLALVLFADVLLRTLFGNGLSWAHQVAVYANIVVSLLGLGLASANGSHLRPRFADHWLPRAWEPQIQRLAALLSAMLLGFFAFLGVQLVLESYALAEKSSVLLIPVWPVQLLLPLAFVLSSIRYLLFSFYPALQPVNESVE
ncbi:TRAP transporter small permease [Oceanicoccus sp. KOV_DT_Chl]|uniref:TRAP transporter small permease n=1 Tax=Oceanicoccus sp. KOV_DT_Chl TaxID=1904639 RepID=UPI000C7A7ADC|nr:TRAP transporter small permease [Oceanicoccus sp. KOV_DT_Chl]